MKYDTGVVAQGAGSQKLFCMTREGRSAEKLFSMKQGPRGGALGGPRGEQETRLPYYGRGVGGIRYISRLEIQFHCSTVCTASYRMYTRQSQKAMIRPSH